jgi:hypothetical protein
LNRAILKTSVAALFVLAGTTAIVEAQQAPADIILTNGKVITVDNRFSIAQAVAVRGDRIVAVGTTADINRLAGPNTRRIDLAGKAVVPGMIDNHAHLMEEGKIWLQELRLDGVTTRARALEMIRAISSPTTRRTSRARSSIASRRTIPCSSSSRAAAPM